MIFLKIIVNYFNQDYVNVTLGFYLFLTADSHRHEITSGINFVFALINILKLENKTKLRRFSVNN